MDNGQMNMTRGQFYLILGSAVDDRVTNSHINLLICDITKKASSRQSSIKWRHKVVCNGHLDLIEIKKRTLMYHLNIIN